MLCDDKWDETINLHIHAFHHQTGDILSVIHEGNNNSRHQFSTLWSSCIVPMKEKSFILVIHDHKEISSLVSNTTHLSQRVSHSWPREDCSCCHGICKIKCWTRIHLIIWCQNVPNEASLLFSAAPSHCRGTNREWWRLALLHNGWCTSSKEPWCSFWLSLALTLHGFFYSQPACRIWNPVLDRVIAAFLLVPDR